MQFGIRYKFHMVFFNSIDPWIQLVRTVSVNIVNLLIMLVRFQDFEHSRIGQHYLKILEEFNIVGLAALCYVFVPPGLASVETICSSYQGT